MSMSFGAAFATFALGDSVVVANGNPEPSKSGGVPWRIWRSHNFTGTLIEKVEGVPRQMVFQLPEEGGVRTSYTIVDGLGHNFTAGA